MKNIFFLLLSGFIASNASSQNIELDKTTGLVKVDGRDSFYLIKKTKGVFGYHDLSLLNINKEEMATFADKATKDLPYDERGGRSGPFYKITFNETGNTVLIDQTLSGLKGVAKKIVSAGLIRYNQIDPKVERNFVLANNGTIFKDPNEKPVTIVVNAAQNNATSTANISIKNSNIYNNDELIGSFKKSTDPNNITTISIYNKDDSKIATATHDDADANADWNLSTTTDGKTTQLLYNSSAPFEKLFKYLAEKGFL